jgi:hypothetical protein
MSVCILLSYFFVFIYKELHMHGLTVLPRINDNEMSKRYVLKNLGNRAKTKKNQRNQRGDHPARMLARDYEVASQ